MKRRKLELRIPHLLFNTYHDESMKVGTRVHKMKLQMLFTSPHMGRYVKEQIKDTASTVSA